jgi:hypothetical protein
MGTVDAGGGELGELADRVAVSDRAAGESVREVAALLRAPIRVHITGRAGVGRTTVATAVKEGAIPGAVIEEPGPLDVPGAPDPVLDGDVVVCVLVDWNREAPAEPGTAEDAVRCAHWWRTQLSGNPTARQRRAIVDVRRHYLRIWQRMGGSPDDGRTLAVRGPG